MSVRTRISLWRHSGAWLALLALVLLSLPSPAQRARRSPPYKVVLEPVLDNTLYQDPTGARSNGRGAHVFAGKTAIGEIRRALLAFDVAGNVPAGAQILSAKLTMHVTRTISGPRTVALHVALASWGEGTSNAGGQEGTGAPSTAGDATWLHRFHPSVFWSMPGGDFAPAASATSIAGFTGPVTWANAAMVADVQGWLDTPATNFGWIVVGAEGVSTTAKRFGSREGTAVLRPTLTIQYE